MKLLEFYRSNDPLSLRSSVAEYLERCRLKGFAASTLEVGQFSLKYFIEFCESRNVRQTRDVDRELMESYAVRLRTEKTKRGTYKAEATVVSYLKRVRSFFRWSAKRKTVLFNPTSCLDLLNRPESRPRDVLTPDEARRILNLPKIHLNRGLRDRAVLETFYSTGIRRGELTGLTLSDFTPEKRTLRIAMGKTGRSRWVPIGEEAIAWTKRYLRNARPHLRRPGTERRRTDVLFTNDFGGRINPPDLSGKVRKYIESAGIEKRGACHLFRHTMATLMLKNGADLRSIQEILGHSRIDTTERYTHLDIDHLIAVHLATHPAERPF